MNRVVWDRPVEVGRWVAKRIGGTFNVDGATAIGLEKDGQLVAGCMFESWRKHSICAHIAIEGEATRAFLRACFGYCFNQLQVDKIIAPVDSGNTAAASFNERLGFFPEAVIAGGAETGDLILFTITRQQCRFLGRVQ